MLNNNTNAVNKVVAILFHSPPPPSNGIILPTPTFNTLLCFTLFILFGRWVDAKETTVKYLECLFYWKGFFLKRKKGIDQKTTQ